MYKIIAAALFMLGLFTFNPAMASSTISDSCNLTENGVDDPTVLSEEVINAVLEASLPYLDIPFDQARDAYNHGTIQISPTGTANVYVVNTTGGNIFEVLVDF